MARDREIGRRSTFIRRETIHWPSNQSELSPVENTGWVLSPQLDRKTTVVGVIKNLAGQTAGRLDRLASNRLGSIDDDDKQCFFPQSRGPVAIKLEYCRDTLELELVEYPGCDLPKLGRNVSFRLPVSFSPALVLLFVLFTIGLRVWLFGTECCPRFDVNRPQILEVLWV